MNSWGKTEEEKEGFTEMGAKEPPSFSSNKHNFKFEEAINENKIVVTIWGEKGSGKSSTALGLSGLKCALSFDYKTQTIKENFYKNDDSVKVYDAVAYFTKDLDFYLESSEVTLDYVMFLLDNIKKMNPDWVIIDGLEIVTNVAEMVMRKRHGLRPYQGIANMSVWRERRQILDAIHRKAMGCVKKGVVYTTYFEDKKVIEDGAIITSRQVPKWVDTVLYVTDVILHVETEVKKGEPKTYVKVNSSKVPGFLKTGEIIDITGKKLSDITKW